MKMIILILTILTSIGSFAASEASRLAGSWKGTFVDRQMNATFILSVKGNGSVIYSDNSSVGPYCEGIVAVDSTSLLKFHLECNKKVSRGAMSKSKHLSLSIINPYQLETVTGVKQIISIQSSSLGLQEMYISKLSNVTYGDLSSESGGFSGIFSISRKGKFIGNMNFTFNQFEELIVNSGYFTLNSTRSIFGENEEIINGYPYARPNRGQYSISDNRATLNISDDNGEEFVITLDLNEIKNEMISTYNLDKPKDIELNVTSAFINGLKYDVKISGTTKY
jgi:hypothetical protein